MVRFHALLNKEPLGLLCIFCPSLFQMQVLVLKHGFVPKYVTSHNHSMRHEQTLTKRQANSLLPFPLSIGGIHLVCTKGTGRAGSIRTIKAHPVHLLMFVLILFRGCIGTYINLPNKCAEQNCIYVGKKQAPQAQVKEAKCLPYKGCYCYIYTLNNLIMVVNNKFIAT